MRDIPLPRHARVPLADIQRHNQQRLSIGSLDAPDTLRRHSGMTGIQHVTPHLQWVQVFPAPPPRCGGQGESLRAYLHLSHSAALRGLRACNAA